VSVACKELAMPVRTAQLADIEAMHRLRLAVSENRLRDLRRVTPEHYREMLEEKGRGWVYEIDGDVRGFAIADRADRNIWALFVAPGFEGRGIGRVLHDVMVAWLFEVSAAPIWLTTEAGTRAASFYAAAGWREVRREGNGELRFELSR
jgi:GNAT superfamily N-acetyltransferase